MQLEPNELSIVRKKSVKEGIAFWEKKVLKRTLVKEPFGVHLDIECIKQSTTKNKRYLTPGPDSEEYILESIETDRPLIYEQKGNAFPGEAGADKKSSSKSLNFPIVKT